MPSPRDPLAHDAAALFAHLRESGADPALPRHWSFEVRAGEFSALAAAAEDLLDTLIAALGREPSLLEPRLLRAKVELDALGRPRTGRPVAEIDFSDALEETELAGIHAALGAFAARQGLEYEGVQCCEAVDSAWEIGPDGHPDPPRRKKNPAKSDHKKRKE